MAHPTNPIDYWHSFVTTTPVEIVFALVLSVEC
jgi:hypothetical protein